MTRRFAAWFALSALPCALTFASPARAADPAPPPAADAAAPAAAPTPTPSSEAATPSAAAPAAAPSAAAPSVVAPGAAAPSASATSEAAPPAPANDAAFYGANAGDEATSATTYPKLELSGFTDFSFIANVSRRHDAEATLSYQYPSFSIGNLNLYLNAALADSWHLLAEVRFLYLPQGTTNFPQNAGQQVVPYDTGVLDYADDNRLLTWGGVQIQRVQIDFTPHPLLSFRFGQWLTPVGIWNVDHGSPTVIGVFRPYIIGQGLFPERQTGIQVSGEWSGETNQVGYFATVSNGRGPSDAYADLDNNKGVGGRLYWNNSAYGSFTLGTSAYKGTYSSRNRQYGLQTPAGQAPELVAVNPLTQQYREQSLAADLRWDYKGVLVQGEAMQHEVVYTNGYRPMQNGLIFADYRERGYYVLAGYRLPWLGVMPFVTVEGYNFASQPYVGPANSESVGLNVRPEPTVVFKLQYQVSQVGVNSTEPLRGTLKRVLTQLAVAF
ncbi:MAG TPA: hypothetical protein VNW92_00535 [Polyangiaceae bacterium]|jgi:hypothetical protein|nr:hypothetical protein [Polyangiaceae bacterium]